VRPAFLDDPPPSARGELGRPAGEPQPPAWLLAWPCRQPQLGHTAEIERLMIEGMLAVVPGMKVETVVSLSLNKAELDPRWCELK
jgi:hypothetical protein